MNNNITVYGQDREYENAFSHYDLCCLSTGTCRSVMYNFFRSIKAFLTGPLDALPGATKTSHSS